MQPAHPRFKAIQNLTAIWLEESANIAAGQVRYNLKSLSAEAIAGHFFYTHGLFAGWMIGIVTESTKSIPELYARMQAAYVLVREAMDKASDPMSMFTYDPPAPAAESTPESAPKPESKEVARRTISEVHFEVQSGQFTRAEDLQHFLAAAILRGMAMAAQAYPGASCSLYFPFSGKLFLLDLKESLSAACRRYESENGIRPAVDLSGGLVNSQVEFLFKNPIAAVRLVAEAGVFLPNAMTDALAIARRPLGGLPHFLIFNDVVFPIEDVTLTVEDLVQAFLEYEKAERAKRKILLQHERQTRGGQLEMVEVQLASCGIVAKDGLVNEALLDESKTLGIPSMYVKAYRDVVDLRRAYERLLATTQVVTTPTNEEIRLAMSENCLRDCRAAAEGLEASEVAALVDRAKSEGELANFHAETHRSIVELRRAYDEASANLKAKTRELQDLKSGLYSTLQAFAQSQSRGISHLTSLAVATVTSSLKEMADGLKPEDNP